MDIKDDVVTVRINRKLKREWQLKAKESGLTLSQWVTLKVMGAMIIMPDQQRVV